jgi:hypothetical protein
MRYCRSAVCLSIALLMLAIAPVASAAPLVKRTLCVFDIVGANGDMFNMMKDYKAAAVAWGVDLTIVPYTDEKIAAEDFKGGQCDAVELTGIRARSFNKYTGTLAAVGAIPDYKTLRLVLQVLSSGNPEIDKHLVTGVNEVAGIAPMGAAYLFVRDRSINTVNKLSGKKISVMAYDPQEAKMARMVGMTPVLSDITNFAGRFNNGSVDMCFAPIAAYSALELYKGLQPNGGIIDYVLGQLVAEVILKKDRFPPGYAQQSREWMFGQFDRAMQIINNAQKAVASKWWVHIPADDRAKYDEMMRTSRIKMTEEGLYDPAMTHLLLRVRCKLDPSRAECANPQE